MFQQELFKQQLKKLMNGCTTTEFAEKTGFNRTYLSKYLNLKLERPPSPHLLKSLANDFVPYEELMVSCGYLPNGTSFRTTMKKIPIIGSIHAGTPVLAVENIEGYEWVDSNDISSSHEYFYLRVEGNSMINARIFDGDLVFVRKQEDIDHGDIAVVMIDQETATLKRVLKKGEFIVLQPENPAYESQIFTGEEQNRLHIIGKVLHVKFKV